MTPKFTFGFVKRRGLRPSGRPGWLEEVPGWICGPFGIHANRIMRGEYWIVHQPTGLGLRSDVSLREGKRLVKKLLASDIDWRFRRQSELSKATLRRIAELAEGLPLRRVA